MMRAATNFIRSIGSAARPSSAAAIFAAGALLASCDVATADAARVAAVPELAGSVTTPPGGPVPASARSVVREYQQCSERCFDDGPETNEATCRLQCVHDVVPGADDEDREDRACLEELAQCVHPCEDEARETDAVTCRLPCEAVTIDCLKGDSK